MNEDERRALREAMELEQEEGYIADKLHYVERQQLDYAIMLRAKYNTYVKAGFSEEQAFVMMLNYNAMMFQAMFNKSDNPNNRKNF